jgi:hypothetical protein
VGKFVTAKGVHQKGKERINKRDTYGKGTSRTNDFRIVELSKSIDYVLRPIRSMGRFAFGLDSHK